MSTGSEAPSRRLAAIMFTDLVGYSALTHRNERLAIELLELHRQMVREILPRHDGIEIETIGDAFLVEFPGALAAVECAVAIQHGFAEYNKDASPDRAMELRIGIHLGDVEHKDGKVMGGGVNIASRIHGVAEPGGICVSEPVRQAVQGHGFSFEGIGAPALKNIDTPLQLYVIQDAPRQGMARIGAKLRRSRRPAVALAAMAVLAAAGLGLWRAGSFQAALANKSVAVLPFENLSAEADSAFFTDGLHDTVIGHLARIHGLKVISRTSVMRYRDQRPDLRQVARELGVASIVEGSVQRSGSRLRVVAQLIDAESDTHLWSSEYDRDISDVFAVQADIAGKVADAVQVKLTPQEQASIKAIPTQSQAAYELFLRARAVERVVAPDATELLQAIAWLDEALRLDPRFALAYALRSTMHDSMDWYAYERSARRREQAKQDAERALALAPDLAEAHTAMAMVLYHGSSDYEGALRELEIARGLAPGDVRTLLWLGAVYRRLDRWDEAQASFERISILDPLNAPLVWEYGHTLTAMRRLDEAGRIYARAAAVDGGPHARRDVDRNRFLRDGDAEAYVRALQELPRDPGCVNLLQRAQMLDALGRQDEALEVIGECNLPSIVLGYYNERVPTAHFVARIKWHRDRSRTPTEAAAAHAMLEKDLAANPDRSGLRMFLAMSLVMSGEHGRALEEAERALKDMPRSRDAWIATGLLAMAAEVHANTGQIDRAFAELEESLARPGGIQFAILRTNPDYAPLRADPRYEKLLAGKPL